MKARTVPLVFLIAAVVGIVLFVLGRGRGPDAVDSGAIATADGWTEPAGVGEAHVQSAGPLPDGGFFVVGANGAGKAWLFRVDAKGQERESLFEAGYLADAVAMPGGRLAVAGYREDNHAFVAKVDDAGKMSDIVLFAGHAGSEMDAVTFDGERVLGVGLENTPRIGHAAGWIIAGGDGTRWAHEAAGSGYVYLAGAAVSNGTLFAGGGAGSSGSYRPWRIARLVDGGVASAASEASSAGKSGHYGAVVALDDGVAFVGTAAFGDELYPKVVVESYAPGGALRLRVRVGEGAGSSADMIGGAIATRDGIAFTIAWGPELNSDGALVVMAKDGRSSITPLPGRGKVSMRKSANWIVALHDREATLVRVRTKPPLPIASTMSRRRLSARPQSSSTPAPAWKTTSA